MRVIAAKCDMPGLNSNGEEVAFLNGFKCRAYRKTDSTLIANWAAEVCKEMLDEVGMNGKDLDLIISTSISPDSLASDESVSAPRLCHPLQKMLGAENAFVFDLLEADWGTAMEIANGFALSQGYQNVLVIRADKSGSSILSDETNGFCLTDGVGVVLFSPSESDVSHIHLENERFEHAEVHFISADQMHESGFKAELKWPYSSHVSEAIQFLSARVRKENNGVEVLEESWFGSTSISSEILGAFSIPWLLQKTKMENRQGEFIGLSFNPFLLKCTTYRMSV